MDPFDSLEDWHLDVVKGRTVLFHKCGGEAKRIFEFRCIRCRAKVPFVLNSGLHESIGAYSFTLYSGVWNTPNSFYICI